MLTNRIVKTIGCKISPILVISLAVLGFSAAVVRAETTTFSPRQLYEYVLGGRVTLQKLDQAEVLYLKSRLVTKEQRHRLEQLESLGYMGGADTYSSKNDPTVCIPFEGNKIDQIIIHYTSFKEGLGLAVWIEDELGEALFEVELDPAQVEDLAGKNEKTIPIEVELEGDSRPATICLDFKSCEAYLAKITVQ